MQNRSSLKLFGWLVVLAAIFFGGVASAQDNKLIVNTGNPDGQLGALSRRPSPGKLETETADDFFLTETTVITSATIVGLIPLETPLADITDVEVEIYHVFPTDSVNPPSGNVPLRMNSPADVEIDKATRDGGPGTLRFATTLLNGNFLVLNTVVNGINKKPDNITHGEEQRSGEEVEIAITFTTPIVLPAGHYFFRPEVRVTGGDFLNRWSGVRLSPGPPAFFNKHKELWTTYDLSVVGGSGHCSKIAVTRSNICS